MSRFQQQLLHCRSPRLWWRRLCQPLCSLLKAPPSSSSPPSSFTYTTHTLYTQLAFEEEVNGNFYNDYCRLFLPEAMNSPRYQANTAAPAAGISGSGPSRHHHHHRKQSSSSGSSPVGSTRSVVFEDQDPLLPHNKRPGSRHQLSRQQAPPPTSYANQSKLISNQFDRKK